MCLCVAGIFELVMRLLWYSVAEVLVSRLTPPLSSDVSPYSLMPPKTRDGLIR